MFLNFKKNREDLSGPLTAKEVDQNRERFLLVLSDMTGHLPHGNHSKANSR